jgi:nucleoside 2-deoxyribosyltransferase
MSDNSIRKFRFLSAVGILAAVMIVLSGGVVVAQTAPVSYLQGKRIYLANPLGFSEAGTRFIREVLAPELTRLGGQVVNPFDLVDKDRVLKIGSMSPSPDRVEEWRLLNVEIGKLNQENIDKCDVVFAVLDGPDVDSGTASEIGYAYARQKLIVGYRSDFRLSADNEGGIVNLQVEHFIRASGGTIISKVSEIEAAFSSLGKGK